MPTTFPLSALQQKNSAANPCRRPAASVTSLVFALVASAGLLLSGCADDSATTPPQEATAATEQSDQTIEPADIGNMATSEAPAPDPLPTSSDDAKATVAASEGQAMPDESAATDDAGAHKNADAEPSTELPVAVKPPPREPIWKAWPKPKLSLMLTSEMHGFFEPCGCTANQLGGMSRRADLRNKLVESGWTVRGLDVGGLARRTTRQAQIKMETTLAALRDLQYVAIGLGPEELRLKPDFLMSQHISDAETPLYFLSANLEFYGVPDIGTPIPSAVFEANGVKVGVTSVLSQTLQAEVLPDPDITWKESSPALKKVLADFDEQQVDLRVLLSQSTIEESEALAAEFPAFDIVLMAECSGDPDPTKPPKKIGDTLMLEAGRKGKYAGVLGFYPDDKETPFRYQLVALERDDFNDTPSMVALMQNYQTRLKDEEIVLQDGVGNPHPSGDSFVGADKCGECHTTAYDIWEKTPHAHALESLDPVHKRLGYERLSGIKRMHDPECLACHVTGWDPQKYTRFQSGFLNEEYAKTDHEKVLHTLMAGSQCENCHGPGSRHVELIEADEVEEAKKLVRVTKAQAEKGMCEKCHDADNSPNYNFEEYWKKVEHYGLD